MTDLFDAIRQPGTDGLPEYRCLIDGEWVATGDGELIDVTSPADGSVLARVPSSSAEKVADAIAVARSAMDGEFAPTRRLEVMERAREIVIENADEIAAVMTAESGKPISHARKEVHATAERLQLTRQEARALYGEYIPGEWVADTENKFAMVTRTPLGVVATLSPFNYPLFIGAAKIIPALLAGNSVVAKPASDTPISLLLLARILQEAGLPHGRLNVLSGSGSRVGKTITGSPHVAAISFTGSTAVGEKLAESAGLKRLHLELGGKAAAIILDDADLGLAAAQVCKGVFSLSGQRCDAVSRVLVQESIKEDFLAEVMKASEEYAPGDPRDESTTMGPLINQDALDKVVGLVDDARQQGAKVVKGGASDGLFHEPTILDEVDREMRVATEEIFGPVMPIITVKDDADALAVSNQSDYGLDGCLFTTSIDRALDLATQMKDGTVSINCAPKHGVGHFPFGGNKRSGMGREGLKYSIDELTRLHTVIVSR